MNSITVKKNNQNIIFLQELHARIYKIILIWILFFTLSILFTKNFIHYFCQPILDSLANSRHYEYIIATKITTPFWIIIKISSIISFVFLLPFIGWHIWSFCYRALTKKEKNQLKYIILCSLILFYTGILFGYYILVPTAIQFFFWVSPAEIQIFTDIASYLDFFIQVSFATAIGFEFPVALHILIWLNICTVYQLKLARRYIIVLVFILAMLLTPPDVVSQILLAIPMLVLYELVLLINKTSS